jgi:SAM-dependent methyltransferase
LIFDHPRLARIYDALDADRSDLDPYVAMADELAARSVLDVGAGTGTFACLLAERGIDVVGVDPAGASLDMAHRKPYADRVRWLLGDATMLPPLQVDLVTMTGNVAQVFLTDGEWAEALRGMHAALRPGGHLVFETRDPARKGWLAWTRDQTDTTTDVDGVGPVRSWVDLTEVVGPLVSFRSTYVFASDGTVLTSDSTLRFRSRQEIETTLHDAGFAVQDVRDAPDRPGREFVLVASRSGGDRPERSRPVS